MGRPSRICLLAISGVERVPAVSRPFSLVFASSPGSRPPSPLSPPSTARDAFASAGHPALGADPLRAARRTLARNTEGARSPRPEDLPWNRGWSMGEYLVWKEVYNTHLLHRSPFTVGVGEAEVTSCIIHRAPSRRTAKRIISSLSPTIGKPSSRSGSVRSSWRMTFVVTPCEVLAWPKISFVVRPNLACLRESSPLTSQF